MQSFQEIIFKLKQYWAHRGCVIQEPYDVEVGAGTMVPETFLRVLGPKPYRVAYVQPSRRPADGRYGDNPNRLFKHYQLQVILKPAPVDVIEQYLGSLEAIGIDLRQHDIKFEEDNWEAPTLGAGGIGWQVMLDGLEISQFTYFQLCGGIDLEVVPAELTYGLERLTAFLQVKDSVYDIEWAAGVSYADVRYRDELQYSVYNFEMADIATLWKLFDLHEDEASRLIALYVAVFSAILRSVAATIRSSTVSESIPSSLAHSASGRSSARSRRHSACSPAMSHCSGSAFAGTERATISEIESLRMSATVAATSRAFMISRRCS